MIRAKVNEIRAKQPKAGAKKLHKHLNKDGIKIGRDSLIEYLRSWGLLIDRKRRYQKTTNSKHRFKTYKNRIKDYLPKRPNEVYASDITYIKTEEGYRYLFLITDIFSRFIVGYAFKANLCVEGALEALERALNQRCDNNKSLIHHSDRGIQYCCHDYIDLLSKDNITISMTEDNHVYENALAERVNGILKDEFLLGETIPSEREARLMVDQAIETYNKERLHMSLGYRTPEEVHFN